MISMHTPLMRTMEQAKIAIDGMHCGACARAVENALAKLPGVKVGAVTVGSADVSYDPSVVDRAAIDRAIEAAGYALRG